MDQPATAFKTPMEEYVYSETPVSLREMAPRWKEHGYTFFKLRNLCAKEKWLALRMKVQTEIRHKAAQLAIERQAKRKADDLETCQSTVRTLQYVYGMPLRKLADETEAAARLAGPGQAVNPHNFAPREIVEAMIKINQLSIQLQTLLRGGGGGGEKPGETWEERLVELAKQIEATRKTGGKIIDVGPAKVMPTNGTGGGNGHPPEGLLL